MLAGTDVNPLPVVSVLGSMNLIAVESAVTLPLRVRSGFPVNRMFGV